MNQPVPKQMAVSTLVRAKASYNPRTIDEFQRERLGASMERFGVVQAVVYNRQTRTLIGGHQTVDQAKAAGTEKLWTMVVDLSETEERALNLALNRIQGEWQMDKLSEVIAALNEVEPELLELTGFPTLEIKSLLARGKDLVDDPGPIEPPDVPITEPGDVWVLGDHRLMCGDSTHPDDIEQLLDGEKALLMATDPPYCVEYTGADRPQDSGKDWSHLYREVEIKDLGEFLRATLHAVLPQLHDHAGIYVWHAHLQYAVIDAVFREFDILRHQPIIWVKPTSTFTYAYYRWAHESCLFGWKQGKKPPHYLENGMTSVWAVDWEGKQRIVGNKHPTQKPVRLFEIPMEMHTRPGEIVLEPFCGSGSQLIAAERLGRKCRAMDISGAFVDAALQRWQAYAEQEATLQDDGRTFADVTKKRTAAPKRKTKKKKEKKA